MKDTILSNVETATHLGIKRSKTDKKNIMNTVDENIKKARRTAYSLMSAGFHGNNGLYDKNSESEFFFSSTKIRIFFQQH
jgi:hypothetical protein